jgi:hypothetical protein
VLHLVPNYGYPVAPISHGELRKYGRKVPSWGTWNETQVMALRKFTSIDDKLVGWIEHRPTGRRSAYRISSQEDLMKAFDPTGHWRIVRLYVVHPYWGDTVPVLMI